MIEQPQLTLEELTYFRALFSPVHLSHGQSRFSQMPLLSHILTVNTETPQVLVSLLGKVKLSLLAEVGPYRLWFPLEMKLDEFGQLRPTFGVPEILDASGAERSWRLTHMKNLYVFDPLLEEHWPVVSLSGSGMAIRAKSLRQFEHLLGSQDLALKLPSGESMRVKIEPLRREKGLAIVRYQVETEARETLRQFLFQCHCRQYAKLYASLRANPSSVAI